MPSAWSQTHSGSHEHTHTHTHKQIGARKCWMMRWEGEFGERWGFRPLCIVKAEVCVGAQAAA